VTEKKENTMEDIKKNNSKLVRYTIQLNMLYDLYRANLISDIEFEKIMKKLKADYKIVSNF
jgi:hypothetical protein